MVVLEIKHILVLKKKIIYIYMYIQVQIGPPYWRVSGMMPDL